MKGHRFKSGIVQFFLPLALKTVRGGSFVCCVPLELISFAWTRLADVEVLFLPWIETTEIPWTASLPPHPAVPLSTRFINSSEANTAHTAVTTSSSTSATPSFTRRAKADVLTEAMPRSDEAQAFFHAVYSAVQEIPPGKVTSYGHIARLVGERELPCLPSQQLPLPGPSCAFFRKR